MKLVRRYDAPARHTGFFNDFFEDFWKDTGFSTNGKLTPAVDVTEDKEKYLVKADLPGLKQEDIKVELDENVLKISGEKKHEHEEKDEKKHYHYCERSYGSFERSFALPKGTDAEHIKAKYEDGVLSVEIPKTEIKKPKEIEVK